MLKETAKEKFMISTVFYTRSRTTTLAAVTVGLVWRVWQKLFNSAEWKKILTIVAAISILSCGFTYGMLQFLQEPYVLSLFQVCCDYVLAFAALGVAGFFSNQNNGLLKGYIVAVLARGAFHALGGYLYWMDYMPDNFPKSLAAVYPIAYNYSFLLAEGLITIVIISIPAVQKALGRVKKIAVE